MEDQWIEIDDSWISFCTGILCISADLFQVSSPTICTTSCHFFFCFFTMNPWAIWIFRLVLWHVLRGSDAKMRPVSAVNAVSLMLRSKEGRMLGGKCCLVTCGLGYRMVCIKWFWCGNRSRLQKMEEDGTRYRTRWSQTESINTERSTLNCWWSMSGGSRDLARCGTCISSSALYPTKVSSWKWSLSLRFWNVLNKLKHKVISWNLLISS